MIELRCKLTHSKSVPELSKSAGVGVPYTNHSLRAISIRGRTCMKGGDSVPETLISEKSGHRSITGVRSTSVSLENATEASTVAHTPPSPPPVFSLTPPS